MAGRYLKIYLGEGLKDKWVSLCQKQNIKTSKPIKEWMEKVVLEAQKQTEPTYRQVIDHPDYSNKNRYEIRLTQSETKAIEEQANHYGCSPQRFIINSIRATLTKEPQMTMDVVSVLWESSRELRAIGRNLNQITRKINIEDYVSDERIDRLLTDIETITKYIYKHTKEVSKVTNASLDRWIIK